MATIPIWKDKIVTLGNSDSVEFRVAVGSATGEIIYNGRAFRRPGETSIKIKVNDICSDYISNTLPNLSQEEFATIFFPIPFYIQKNVSGTWTDVEVVYFLNDWSYDDSFDPETMGLAAPINGRIDARQLLLYTAYESSEIDVTITYEDGTTSTERLEVEISSDNDFLRSISVAASGTAVLDLSTFSNVAKVSIVNKTWEVVSDCREWVLYYLNAFGGWDSLLIEGNTVESDNLTRHNREVEYDNRDFANRGRQNYVNEIEKTYTLNTTWLSDDESSRMHHLLESTDVFLYNINTGAMLPVVVNNSVVEHKTFKGNGGRMNNYTIDVTIAQERVRK